MKAIHIFVLVHVHIPTIHMYCVPMFSAHEFFLLYFIQSTEVLSHPSRFFSELVIRIFVPGGYTPALADEYHELFLLLPGGSCPDRMTEERINALFR